MTEEPARKTVRKTLRREAAAPDADFRRKVILMCVAGAVLLFVGVAAVIVFEPSPDRLRADSTVTKTPTIDRRPPERTPEQAEDPDSDLDDGARRFFRQGEFFEKSQPPRPDLAIAEYHKVCVRFPQTEWATKAEQREHDLRERMRADIEKEFADLCRDAKALRDAGDFRGAMELLSRRVSSINEALKRRAEVEIGKIANDARKKFNATVKQVEELADNGEYDKAIGLFQQLEPALPDDVRAAGRKEIKALESVRPASRQGGTVPDKAAEDLAAAGPTLLQMCRNRQFAEALNILDGLPDAACVRDEREIVTAAAAFWEAFLKAMRARINQKIALTMTDNKRVVGKLSQVSDNDFVFDGQSCGYERLQDDQLVRIAIGKGGLAESEGQSYADAAMFFFGQGKLELSRIYLATAKEMGFATESLERGWRSGAIRAALAAKK